MLDKFKLKTLNSSSKDMFKLKSNQNIFNKTNSMRNFDSRYLSKQSLQPQFNKPMNSFNRTQSRFNLYSSKVADVNKKITDMFERKTSGFMYGNVAGQKGYTKDISPNSLLGQFQRYDPATGMIKTYQPTLASNIKKATISGMFTGEVPEVVGQDFDYRKYQNNPGYKIERDAKGNVTRIYSLGVYEPDEKNNVKAQYMPEEIIVQNGKIKAWYKRDRYVASTTGKKNYAKESIYNKNEKLYDSNGLLIKEIERDADTKKGKDYERVVEEKVVNYKNGVRISQTQNYYDSDLKRYAQREIDYQQGKELYIPRSGQRQEKTFDKVIIGTEDYSRAVLPGIDINYQPLPATTEAEVKKSAGATYSGVDIVFAGLDDEGKPIYKEDIYNVETNVTPTYLDVKEVGSEDLYKSKEYTDLLKQWNVYALQEQKYKQALERQKRREEGRIVAQQSITSPQRKMFDKPIRPVPAQQQIKKSSQQTFTVKKPMQQMQNRRFTVKVK